MAPRKFCRSHGTGCLVLFLAFAVLFLSPVISPAVAQDAATAFGSPSASTQGDTLSGKVVQLFVGVTVLSLAPGLAMMVTCLPFMLIVLSILRQGTGLQQTPPNMLIVSIALFLTFFVMEPVFKEAWATGAQPYIDGEIDEQSAFLKIMEPLRAFMLGRVNPEALVILNDARGAAETVDFDRPPLVLLAPSFVLSEVQRAFEIGFVILLPFLIIDLLVASILMAMGMVMLPPAIVSLPFKVVFFVLTNAWITVSGALVRGYST